MFSNERKVSRSTHNKTLSSFLFLHRKVLQLDLSWPTVMRRLQEPRRLPAVLTQAEVTA